MIGVVVAITEVFWKPGLPTTIVLLCSIEYNNTVVVGKLGFPENLGNRNDNSYQGSGSQIGVPLFNPPFVIANHN